MRNSTHRILSCFLFGLGSQLQLFGTSLCFTELFVFIATPVLLSHELPYLRRNGLMTFFYLSLLVVFGCVIGCVLNNSPMYAVVRGMAVVCLLPCTIVVGHWLLRKNMNGFKWYLLGVVLSNVLCTFVFQRSSEVSMLAGGEFGENATEAIMSGPVYWISRLGGVVSLPAQGWYLRCPLVYSMGAPVFIAMFAMLTSISGRSAALGAIGSAVLVFLGGKKQCTMRRLGRCFWAIMILGIVGVIVLKNVYVYAATNNLLGDEARKKYERQTRGDTSMMSLLMGGRMESFCGLTACVDKPLVGFGPWAYDLNGYIGKFLSKYGSPEDYAVYQKEVMRNSGGRLLIPCHSTVTMFWLWYGAGGLIFILYIIFALLRYLRQDCWAVPQWYMWIAAGIPAYFWNLFFSAWANRVGGVLIVVACLMVRAVRCNRQPLPMEMIVEIENVNRG